RKHRGQLATDHELDDIVFGNFVAPDGLDDLTILEHRDAVGNFKDLFEPVGDVDEADSLTLQPIKHTEKLPCFLWSEYCCWLIQDKDLHILGELFRDFDHLLVSDSQILNQ